MRLTRLELHGFKSFADATTLTFREGVTAIVGPNGCGKSNVSDAVRWVLGEQRARLLRGAKMEEVIFQGSSARRAVQLAEVSLAVANEDGALPVPFREVVITRRLSRSGESEYLLNGAPCRLRDIHDLVRGTGLGADAGVVIEQRMIDALLSDRPDERRELFEEAAGVSFYRDRRRTTERRLEETAADLARLDDLLGEVTNQVRSLARQRKRAERHRELTQRRFAVELTLAQRELAGWAAELTALEARVAALRADAPRVADAVGAATRDRAAAHEARAAAEAARAELARLAADQRDRVRDLEQEVRVAEERQRNAAAQAAQREAERRDEALRADQVAHACAEAERARAAAAEALTTAAATLQARTAEEEGARGAVAAARGALAGAEEEARVERERTRALELERERAERERAEVGQRLSTLAQELVALKDGVASAARDAAAAEAAVAVAQGAATAAQEALEGARRAAQAAAAADATARDDARRAEEARTALRGTVDALDTLDRERVGLAPAAARLLRERAAFGDGVVGPLTDFIGADADAALLVERFLGASLHAVVVRDAAAAEAVRAWHQREDPGPLLLLPLDAAGADGGSDGLDALAGRVRAEPVAARWVRALLGGVHPLDAGTAFRDARGAVWLPGTAAGAGLLQRRAELEGMRAALADAERARDAAVAVAAAAGAALAEAERVAGAALERATAAQRALHDAQARHAEATRVHARAARDLHDAEAAVARLGARRSELGDALAAVDAGARDLAAALAAREAAITEARAALAAAESAHEAAREARTAAAIAHGQRTADLQVARDRADRLAAERATVTQRLDALAAELARLAEVEAGVARQAATWRLDLEERRAALADLDGRLAAAERQVAAAAEASAAADRALDEARRAEAAAADALHQAELRHADLASRRSVIRGRLEAEWRRPFEELLEGFAPLEGDDATLRADAEAVRQQLEALGPVNPLAVEEHEEELRRLDFLTRQRADLGEAQRTLHQAIREIDATARDLFLSTFAAVRENFRQIFLTLFGGGECDLRLADAERPLDCDIEIHAAPRGKRTQRIHLLSSGERALVALSLLFGIFLSKPSPFCLLDEVDAPLDDANIGRFVRMLTEFKQKTQFIVITHNPRTTTEAADAVYGVTMQEPGVSSLVSVRLTGPAVDDDDPAASGAAA